MPPKQTLVSLSNLTPNRPWLQTSSLTRSLLTILSTTLHSLSLPTNPNPKPRSSILKWFVSLTTVDPNFTQLLLQIRWIYESTRVFGSKEGERVEECLCSAKCLDSVIVCEEFVEDMDRFVEAMERVSNGGFLRGEESEVGSDWVELGWLKAKGYYSIESIVANRLEVALRLAWLNCNNGKKNGVKLKEKASKAGVAANVFWRKKGCVNWWGNLDAAIRRKVLFVVVEKRQKLWYYLGT